MAIVSGAGQVLQRVTWQLFNALMGQLSVVSSQLPNACACPGVDSRWQSFAAPENEPWKTKPSRLPRCRSWRLFRTTGGGPPGAEDSGHGESAGRRTARKSSGNAAEAETRGPCGMEAGKRAGKSLRVDRELSLYISREEHRERVTKPTQTATLEWRAGARTGADVSGLSVVHCQTGSPGFSLGCDPATFQAAFAGRPSEAQGAAGAMVYEAGRRAKGGEEGSGKEFVDENKNATIEPNSGQVAGFA